MSYKKGLIIIVVLLFLAMAFYFLISRLVLPESSQITHMSGHSHGHSVPIYPDDLACPNRDNVPVCGRLNGQIQTFQSACFAQKSGVANQDITLGSCENNQEAVSGVATIEPQGRCPDVTFPVCGVSGSLKRTFDNECLANQAGVTVYIEGLCPQENVAPMLEAPTL